MRKFKDYFPPDTERWKEMIYLVAMCLFLNMGFGLIDGFAIYENALSELYEVLSYGKRLIPGSMLPTFGELITGVYRLFWLYILLCLSIVFDHYLQFRRESRSIYLMKRLPNGAKEQFIRCWSVPLAAIAIGLVVDIMVLFAIYLVYLYRTPEGCLQGKAVFEFWRAFYLIKH